MKKDEDFRKVINYLQGIKFSNSDIVDFAEYVRKHSISEIIFDYFHLLGIPTTHYYYLAAVLKEIVCCQDPDFFINPNSFNSVLRHVQKMLFLNVTEEVFKEKLSKDIHIFLARNNNKMEFTKLFQNSTSYSVFDFYQILYKDFCKKSKSKEPILF